VRLAQYQVVAARRQNFDAMVWQVPALGLTALHSSLGAALITLLASYLKPAESPRTSQPAVGFPEPLSVASVMCQAWPP